MPTMAAEPTTVPLVALAIAGAQLTFGPSP
jgi:hypothetical protein